MSDIIIAISIFCSSLQPMEQPRSGGTREVCMRHMVSRFNEKKQSIHKDATEEQLLWECVVEYLKD